MVSREVSSWIAKDSDDNATSTATKAAPSGGLSHFVTSISAGYSATVSGALLVLKEGTTEIGRWYVYDSLTLSFSSPIKITAGDAVSAELAASGGAGTIGAVTLTGYTL